jgi:hypothetical protein
MGYMKSVSLISILGASVLLSGCMTTNNNNLTLETVGPVPSQPQATSTDSSANGTLVVYSAFKRNADFNASDPTHPEHSDYKIFNPDGSVVLKVHNVTKTVFEDAVPVGLAPGKYVVGARANGYGYLKIPVVIEPEQRTVIHLEGGDPWPEQWLFNATNAVRLPGGEIIGWKYTGN